MPSARDPHKRGFHLYINSFLYAKFKKLSKELDCSMVDIIIAYIESRTRHITLTKEENEKVVAEIQKRIR